MDFINFSVYSDKQMIVNMENIANKTFILDISSASDKHCLLAYFAGDLKKQMWLTVNRIQTG